MKKLITLFAFVAAISFTVVATNDNASAPSATTTLSGQVIDKATGEALAGVKILIDNDQETYTDLDGNFSIESVTTGDHSIKADLISYKSEEKLINVSPDKQKLEIKIENN